MPVAPIACAAMGTPHVCASSTAASTSSRVNAVKSTGMPGVSTPPVATILIERAPARICSRTASRTPSAPSACRANELQPWPPVIVSARPDGTTRGPGMRPPSIARATSHTTAPNPPRSRTVVVPARRCRSAFPAHLIAAKGSETSASPTKSGSPSKHRCTWESISPGVSVRPPPESSRAALASRGARRVRADPADDAVLEQDPGVFPRPRAVDDRDVVDVGRGHPASPAPEPGPPRPASWRSADRSGEYTRGRSPNSSPILPASSAGSQRSPLRTSLTGVHPW